ncbi:hypothetical protein TB2_025632 [Malus domestica]
MSLVQGKWIKENWCANFWVFVYNLALIHCSSRHDGRGSMRVEIDLVVSIRRLFFKGCFRFIKVSSGIHYITECLGACMTRSPTKWYSGADSDDGGGWSGSGGGDDAAATSMTLTSGCFIHSC